MVCIQIRTDFLSILIWVQTVCKGYQQMTKVTDKGPEKQNNFEIHVGGPLKEQRDPPNRIVTNKMGNLSSQEKVNMFGNFILKIFLG